MVTTTAPMTIAGRSHGYQPDARLRSSVDHHAVTSTDATMNSRAMTLSRCCHSTTAPMPTSAPIAGASATV